VCPHVVFADTVMNSLSRSEEVARAAVGLLTRLRTSP
jgi:hypothetical protein